MTKQSFCKRLTKLIKSPNYRYSHSPTYGNPNLFQMCRRYPGFKRVALQDPQPERRFFRRGWVTFSKECNIKEVCWSLNNIRVSPVLSTLYLSFMLQEANVGSVISVVELVALQSCSAMNWRFVRRLFLLLYFPSDSPSLQRHVWKQMDPFWTIAKAFSCMFNKEMHLKQTYTSKELKTRVFWWEEAPQKVFTIVYDAMFFPITLIFNFKGCVSMEYI